MSIDNMPDPMRTKGAGKGTSLIESSVHATHEGDDEVCILMFWKIMAVGNNLVNKSPFVVMPLHVWPKCYRDISDVR